MEAKIGTQFNQVNALKLEGNAVNTGHVKEKDAETKVNTDQVTISLEVAEEKVLDPKATVNSVIDETASKFKDFLNNNPLWTTFAEGLLAGATAGVLAKKVEQNKAAELNKEKLSQEITDYMKDLKTNMERTYKKEKMLIVKNKIRNALYNTCAVTSVILGSTAFLALFTGSFTSLAAFAHGEPEAKTILLAGSLIGFGSIGAVNLLKTAKDRLSHPLEVPSVRTKGERYLPIGSNRFLTITPDSNKLLMCQIEKNKATGELYPTLLHKEDLPDQPVSLDKGNKHWRDNWLKQTFKRISSKISPNVTHYENLKVEDYGAKINYANPNLTSEVSMYSYSHDYVVTDMNVTNIDKEAERRKVQQSWDSLKDEMK